MARLDEGAAVGVLLAAAGLDLSPAEQAAFEQFYRDFRPAVDALYRVEEARYEVPAQSFRAAPELDPWRPG